MLTRRNVLTAVAAGALMSVREAPGRPPQPPPTASFYLRPEPCNCHPHIFGDPNHFPFWSGRSYTPEPALPADMAALHRAIHIKRVVIVTPSVYGTDNSATLYGLKARAGTARGVAVINDK